MEPRKDKFPGEHKLRPVATKTKRFVKNADGEIDIVLDPPALGSSEDTATTYDFPLWNTLSCDEILKAIEKLKYTMTVIRVDEVTYNMYLDQIALGEATYAKKCTGGIKTPADTICADNEVLTEVTECPECTKSTPPCDLPCRVVKKCVPKDSGTGGGGVLLGGGLGLGPAGGDGGGGGAATEEKSTYSWLWLVFVAAGVYVLTRKSE
jgi:hypothetical protein